MTDPDPDRLLYDIVSSNWTVPKWVEPNLRSRCKHCEIKFSHGHKHNCRLCGDLFCSSCTSKYHLPISFEKKGKYGAARVCLSCKGKALELLEQEEKDHGLNIPSPRVMRERTPSFSKSLKTGTIVIHPPEWVDLDSQVDCFKCRIFFKKKKKHHCRTCGRLFCEDCSSKMDVPPAFKKKNKKGPVRVCDICRYFIVKGAELTEDVLPIPLPPSTDPQPPKHQHQSEDALVLGVCWEGQRCPLTELEIPSPSTSLADINIRLMDARPELQTDKFSFLCRNKPVWKEHWDIFTYTHIKPIVYLRADTSHVLPIQQSLSPRPQEVVKHTRNLASFQDKRQSLTQVSKKYTVATVMHSYSKPNDPSHLELVKGDKIHVAVKDNDQWWFGKIKEKGTKGWFPASYVRVEPKRKSKRDSDDIPPPPPPPAPEEKKEEKAEEDVAVSLNIPSSKRASTESSQMVDDMFSDTDDEPQDTGNEEKDDDRALDCELPPAPEPTTIRQSTAPVPRLSLPSSLTPKSADPKADEEGVHLPPPPAPGQGRSPRSPRVSPRSPQSPSRIPRISPRRSPRRSTQPIKTPSDLNDVFKQRAKMFQ